MRWEGSEADSAAGHMALATRQWGSRIAACLDELAILGQEFLCRGGRARFRLLVGLRRCGTRVRTIDPHRAILHLGGLGQSQLRVLVQETLQDDTNLAIAGYADEVQALGASMAWHTEIIYPGRGPGM